MPSSTCTRVRWMSSPPGPASAGSAIWWAHRLTNLPVARCAWRRARAFVEGLLFEIRRCIDVLAEAAAVERVVACGPMLADDVALAMTADALARPVHRFDSVSSPSALGAALL